MTGNDNVSPLPSPGQTKQTSGVDEDGAGGAGGQQPNTDEIVDDRDETMGVSLGAKAQGHLVGVRCVSTPHMSSAFCIVWFFFFLTVCSMRFNFDG